MSLPEPKQHRSCSKRMSELRRNGFERGTHPPRSARVKPAPRFVSHFVQIHFFRFVSSDSFLHHMADLTISRSIFGRQLMLLLFRFVCSDHLFVQIRLFRFLCSDSFVQIQIRFSSDSFIQIRLFVQVSSDSFVQIQIRCLS